jgi:hypothetical protein
MFLIANLPKGVPIVRYAKLPASMKHALVVRVLPASNVEIGDLDPSLEESEPRPDRIQWVLDSAKSLTGAGSRESILEQPSPSEAHRVTQSRPMALAGLSPTNWGGRLCGE